MQSQTNGPRFTFHSRSVKKRLGDWERDKEQLSVCVCVRERNFSQACLVADDPQSIGPGSSLQLSFSTSEAPCLISAKVI